MHNTPLCSVVYNTPPSLQPRARLHHLQYLTNEIMIIFGEAFLEELWSPIL